MRKAKVRPPRKPHGENAKVTIANQARQIRNLTDRCAKLVFERDDALTRANRTVLDLDLAQHNLAHQEQFRSADVARLAEAKAEIARLKTHIEGYRMAIADFMQPDRIPRIG